MTNRERELDVWKFVAPEFVFGLDARHLAGRYARNFGLRKVLVVTDPGVIAAGWTEQVTVGLDAAGLSYDVFSGVTANPRVEEVMTGAELYQRADYDGIVVVGGGSPIDCAKGIGIVSSNGKHILEFEGVDEVPIPGPPLICVPTTAGSSADVSQFMVITDLRQRRRPSIISKTVVPDVTLIDPLTTTTMSPYVTACTGIDALTHAIEAFVSSAHSPVTDLHALDAIRLISRSLPATLEWPASIEPRNQQMLGSLEAGIAFSNASLGAVHAMAHSVGGLLDLAHGECNAICLGAVIAFNFEAAADRYRLIGEAMGLDLRRRSLEEQRSALVDEVNRLRTAVGLGRTLEQVGVRSGDIPELAEKALRDPCLVTNPRRLNRRELEALFAQAC